MRARNVPCARPATGARSPPRTCPASGAKSRAGCGPTALARRHKRAASALARAKRLSRLRALPPRALCSTNALQLSALSEPMAAVSASVYFSSLAFWSESAAMASSDAMARSRAECPHAPRRCAAGCAAPPCAAGTRTRFGSAAGEGTSCSNSAELRGVTLTLRDLRAACLACCVLRDLRALRAARPVTSRVRPARTPRAARRPQSNDVSRTARNRSTSVGVICAQRDTSADAHAQASTAMAQSAPRRWGGPLR